MALYLVYLFGQLIQCTLSLYLPFENGTPFTYLLKKTEFTYITIFADTTFDLLIGSITPASAVLGRGFGA